MRPMPHEPTPTILLVEDEDPVRRLIAKLLGTRNYTILEANQGETALAVSESFPGPIHLLITDIMMPVMNGKELAARLANLRPGLKVLYISGYPGRFLPVGAGENGEEEFLSKPFKSDILLAKVDSLLRGQGGGAKGGSASSGPFQSA
jgi:two-component system cell cycle sensor histidine kinase/response regulator CckA